MYNGSKIGDPSTAQGTHLFLFGHELHGKPKIYFYHNTGTLSGSPFSFSPDSSTNGAKTNTLIYTNNTHQYCLRNLTALRAEPRKG